MAALDPFLRVLVAAHGVSAGGWNGHPRDWGVSGGAPRRKAGVTAPVFSADGEVEVYLPEGTWTHLLSGERVTGPCWRTEHHGYDSLPLYVREGAVLPLAGDDSRPDGDWLAAPVLLVHPTGAPDWTAEVTVVDTAGLPEATFRVRRDGDVLRVTASGTDRPFTVRVPGGAEASGTGEVTVPAAG